MGKIPGAKLHFKDVWNTSKQFRCDHQKLVLSALIDRYVVFLVMEYRVEL